MASGDTPYQLSELPPEIAQNPTVPVGVMVDGVLGCALMLELDINTTLDVVRERIAASPVYSQLAFDFVKLTGTRPAIKRSAEARTVLAAQFPRFHRPAKPAGWPEALVMARLGGGQVQTKNGANTVLVLLVVTIRVNEVDMVSVAGRDLEQRTPLHELVEELTQLAPDSFELQERIRRALDMIERNASDLSAIDAAGRTVLHVAAWRNCAALIDSVFRLAVNNPAVAQHLTAALDIADHRHATPLMTALMHSHWALFDVFSGMKEANPPLFNPGMPDLLKMWPNDLSIAALWVQKFGSIYELANQGKSADLVRLLNSPLKAALAGTTSVNGTDLFFVDSALCAAVRVTNLECVRALLRADASLSILNGSRQSPLHVAACLPREKLTGARLDARLQILNELLACNPDAALLNAQDTRGHTALHLAALSRWQAGVERLLEAGAATDSFDHMEYSPLHIAVINGDAQMAKTILKRADVNARAPVKAQQYAQGTELPKRLRDCAQYSRDKRRYDFNPERVESTAPGPTVLEVAVAHGHDDLTRWLIESGADRSARTSSGASLFELALRTGHGALCRHLPEEFTEHYSTILTSCIRVGDLETVTLIANLKVPFPDHVVRDAVQFNRTEIALLVLSRMSSAQRVVALADGLSARSSTVCSVIFQRQPEREAFNEAVFDRFPQDLAKLNDEQVMNLASYVQLRLLARLYALRPKISIDMLLRLARSRVEGLGWDGEPETVRILDDILARCPIDKAEVENASHYYSFDELVRNLIRGGASGDRVWPLLRCLEQERWGFKLIDAVAYATTETCLTLIKNVRDEARERVPSNMIDEAACKGRLDLLIGLTLLGIEPVHVRIGEPWKQVDIPNVLAVNRLVRALHFKSNHLYTSYFTPRFNGTSASYMRPTEYILRRVHEHFAREAKGTTKKVTTEGEEDNAEGEEDTLTDYHKFEFTVLHELCLQGDLELVSKFLQLAGPAQRDWINKTPSDHQVTPLMLAALSGHLDVVSALCATGEVDWTLPGNAQALLAAIVTEKDETAMWLIDRQNAPGLPLDAIATVPLVVARAGALGERRPFKQDIYAPAHGILSHFTALQAAAARQHWGLYDALVKRGASFAPRARVHVTSSDATKWQTVEATTLQLIVGGHFRALGTSGYRVCWARPNEHREAELRALEAMKSSSTIDWNEAEDGIVCTALIRGMRDVAARALEMGADPFFRNPRTHWSAVSVAAVTGVALEPLFQFNSAKARAVLQSVKWTAPFHFEEFESEPPVVLALRHRNAAIAARLFVASLVASDDDELKTKLLSDKFMACALAAAPDAILAIIATPGAVDLMESLNPNWYPHFVSALIRADSTKRLAVLSGKKAATNNDMSMQSRLQGLWQKHLSDEMLWFAAVLGKDAVCVFLADAGLSLRKAVQATGPPAGICQQGEGSFNRAMTVQETFMNLICGQGLRQTAMRLAKELSPAELAQLRETGRDTYQPTVATDEDTGQQVIESLSTPHEMGWMSTVFLGGRVSDLWRILGVPRAKIEQDVAGLRRYELESNSARKEPSLRFNGVYWLETTYGADYCEGVNVHVDYTVDVPPPAPYGGDDVESLVAVILDAGASCLTRVGTLPISPNEYCSLADMAVLTENIPSLERLLELFTTSVTDAEMAYNRAMRGKKFVAAEFLIRHVPALVNSTPDKLHRAVAAGAVSLVKAILNAGAPIEAVDDGGMRAIEYAAGLGNREMVQLLTARGSDSHVTGFVPSSMALAEQAGMVTLSGYQSLLDTLNTSTKDGMTQSQPKVTSPQSRASRRGRYEHLMNEDGQMVPRSLSYDSPQRLNAYDVVLIQGATSGGKSGREAVEAQLARVRADVAGCSTRAVPLVEVGINMSSFEKLPAAVKDVVCARLPSSLLMGRWASVVANLCVDESGAETLKSIRRYELEFVRKEDQVEILLEDRCIIDRVYATEETILSCGTDELLGVFYDMLGLRQRRFTDPSEALPIELFYLLLTYLRIGDLQTCRQVSKQWQRFATDQVTIDKIKARQAKRRNHTEYFYTMYNRGSRPRKLMLAGRHPRPVDDVQE